MKQIQMHHGISSGNLREQRCFTVLFHHAIPTSFSRQLQRESSELGWQYLMALTPAVDRPAQLLAYV